MATQTIQLPPRKSRAEFNLRRCFTLPLVVWALLFGWPAAALANPGFYTAKRGDTLYGVARRYGITAAELAEKNGLKPTAWLQVGQRLSVPDHVKSRQTTALPASVQRAITTARVSPGRWKRIVIHHSGTTQASIRGMTYYHLKVRHMEHGLAYHFVIGNGHGFGDGKIFVGDRWKKQLDGGHLASAAQNHYSIGICLVGDFDHQRPTARQLKSLTALVEALLKRCKLGVSAVVTHRQINVKPTRCPGKNFPFTTLKRHLTGASS